MQLRFFKCLVILYLTQLSYQALEYFIGWKLCLKLSLKYYYGQFGDKRINSKCLKLLVYAVWHSLLIYTFRDWRCHVSLYNREVNCTSYFLALLLFSDPAWKREDEKRKKRVGREVFIWIKCITVHVTVSRVRIRLRAQWQRRARGRRFDLTGTSAFLKFYMLVGEEKSRWRNSSTAWNSSPTRPSAGLCYITKLVLWTKVGSVIGFVCGLKYLYFNTCNACYATI